MLKEVEEYNEFLRQKFERTKTVEDLLKYVVSETLPPIADYDNAIKVIRENKVAYKNSTLLIIGAYLITEWTYDEENDLLNDLVEMQDCLSDQELAIMHYLIANHLCGRQSCRQLTAHQHLLQSMKYKGPFVNNRLLCAGFFSAHHSVEMMDRQMMREALENVVEIHDQKYLDSVTEVYFVEPQNFINEHILGTHISDSWYSILRGKLE